MSTTSSTVAGDKTPTHSSVTDDLLGDRHSPTASTSRRETVPWPGHTFIIRDPDSGRQITLECGELLLRSDRGNQGGYHWDCVEKDGWLGFRDPVHGMYMGHNNRGSFIAQVKHHKGYEFFCARRHPDGGYLLLTQHWNELWKMTIGKDGRSLVETTGKGTAWEFVDVTDRFGFYEE
ncbi:hypothetical protein M426DRAFT_70257 [Hypoxylon sp. CI-4A]|nr:hypothetical protein M426DRAFT_70257 [Hypoxylon sp. CI-4A]